MRTTQRRWVRVLIEVSKKLTIKKKTFTLCEVIYIYIYIYITSHKVDVFFFIIKSATHQFIFHALDMCIILFVICAFLPALPSVTIRVYHGNSHRVALLWNKIGCSSQEWKPAVGHSLLFSRIITAMSCLRCSCLLRIVSSVFLFMYMGSELLC